MSKDHELRPEESALLAAVESGSLRATIPAHLYRQDPERWAPLVADGRIKVRADV